MPMLNNDREEFMRHLSRLCAAYNVPLGDRPEAYWSAFSKYIGVIEFGRVVDRALDQDGPDKMPTVKMLWNIRRQMKVIPQTPHTQSNNIPLLLTEEAMRRWRTHLSVYQMVSQWKFITRFSTGYPLPKKEAVENWSAEFLGVIIEQDEKEPGRYRARRLMAKDLELLGAVKHG